MKKLIEHKNIFLGQRVKLLPTASCRFISFLNGSNANYIDELYEVWKKEPNSVHKSWALLFQAVERGVDIRQYYTSPPPAAFGSILSSQSKITHSANVDPKIIEENLAVGGLIAAYQSRGHLLSQIDPLNFEFSDPSPSLAELVLAYWGLESHHMNKVYSLPKSVFLGSDRREMTLSEIVEKLRKIYTGSIGFEYTHVSSVEQVEWLRRRIEETQQVLDKKTKILQLQRLAEATLFEYFLAKKFPSEKRFGLEGCDSMVNCLTAIIDRVNSGGVSSVVLGMAHRGRLNILSNVCRQPLKHIFTRFNDELAMEEGGSSDVKYHLGVSNIVENSQTGKIIKLSMVANPSHLEAVDPVVKGKVKAEQVALNDDGTKVMGILIHGDAAFAGQGIVFETVNLSELPSFNIHGTVHIATNNQIGFTTDPKFSRSSRYCSDVAKSVDAPVFHVNADDPEAVLRVATIAADYRTTFKKDVFIDIVGYRRNGHNEGDNPFFTQPLMYKTIASRPDSLTEYANKLIKENTLTTEEYQEIYNQYNNLLEAEFSKAQQSTVVLNNIWIDSPWKGFFKKEKSYQTLSTGFNVEKLKEFQAKCLQLPEDLVVHPMIKRVLAGRQELLDNNKLDWAMGEIAAFSTLLSEGVHVRLTGQDAERGTFSHRHHVLHDMEKKDKTYNPLVNFQSGQAVYTVANSPLSEYAVMGFEHGYSMSSPHSLCIWESQFGDFFNTAQCIVDQFICSGEDKWIRQSGIVLLLPHGFDGMGPEHSSGRIERFLQLSKEDPDIYPNYLPEEFEVRQLSKANQIVALPTTPANLFHLLRRQLVYNFRKPLIVFSPKNLLRHEGARSSFDDLGPGTGFRRVIPEEGKACEKPNNVKRLIFCSGKVYFELLKERKSKLLDETVAIARIEQLSPFPFDLVREEVNRFPNAELFYVQEEPKNQGAYFHVKPMILLSADNKRKIKYVGRPVSASPATGSKHQHNIEQNALIIEALTV